MREFEEDLQEAVAYHGHLCSGQIIGVRMARLGLRLLGIENPKAFRDLITYVECDRCITDAVGTVTHCNIGKRRLKWVDYGKTAATFLNLQTGKAVRVYREYHHYPPEGADLVAFFNAIGDEEMFRVEKVKVNYLPEDLPGKPLYAEICGKCGEEVLDGRHLRQGDMVLCKACAQGTYYERVES